LVLAFKHVNHSFCSASTFIGIFRDKNKEYEKREEVKEIVKRIEEKTQDA
jgi:hypothetical protein